MKFDIRETAAERIILCAHRGIFGGNIPCNTIASFDFAIAEGADMIELDVTKSADGELFVFHPGMERSPPIRTPRNFRNGMNARYAAPPMRSAAAAVFATFARIGFAQPFI